MVNSAHAIGAQALEMHQRFYWPSCGKWPIEREMGPMEPAGPAAFTPSVQTFHGCALAGDGAELKAQGSIPFGLETRAELALSGAL
jgi:hypothetical protein